ncbi:MAG: putative dehydrogenase [Rhodobacteraceae bacterium HLUCCA08]|nr:MAG: putative dehydrogenase [Rhodobacteraceae bacterium HLUCCA08]
MGDALNIWVLGTGSIGRRHAENFAALGADVTRLSWRETGADGLAARLAAGAPDGMVIATATHVRTEIVRLAAARSVPLYIEKPVAFRAGDLDAIMAALGPLAARCFAGFMMRYHPVVAALKARAPAPYRFAFEIGHDVTRWRENWTFSDSYAAREDGGGVLLDLCHELDLAHHLIGHLTLQDTACLGHAAWPGIDFSTLVRADTATAHGTIAMDYLAPVGHRRIALRARDAEIEADLLAATLTIRSAAGADTDTFDFDRNAMFLAIAADWLRVLRGQPPDHPHAPRLDHCKDTCRLIARAWERRHFHGLIEKELS